MASGVGVPRRLALGAFTLAVAATGVEAGAATAAPGFAGVAAPGAVAAGVTSAVAATAGLSRVFRRRRPGALPAASPRSPLRPERRLAATPLRRDAVTP